MPVEDIDGKLSFANNEDRWTDGLKKAYGFNEEEKSCHTEAQQCFDTGVKFRPRSITQDTWKALSVEG